MRGMEDHRSLGEPSCINQIGSTVKVPDWGHCCIVDLGVRRALVLLPNGELEEVEIAELTVLEPVLAGDGSIAVDPSDPPV